ncbi:hypothetical protein LPTSP4_15210 [Leptospira ryugenii]|uniref:Ig-like domain-containing protein n=2 Tax=Leptospira ryugenii TaxID=1917863 RepID=A0A2P2DZF0_9LEPT|nr:hypothetical protein LPTSP4_15210 [Leptospira ryugenii]
MVFSAEKPDSLYIKNLVPASYQASDGTLFVNEFYRLTWEKNEANTKFFVKWNDDPWIEYSEPLVPPILGWNELFFYAEDPVGNKESENKINLYVDRTSPKLSVNWRYLPKLWNDQYIVQTNNELVIRASDEESGIQNLVVSLDDGEEQLFAAGKDFQIQTKEEGKHRLVAFAFDQVKNISRRWEIAWLVDASAPSLSLNTIPKLIQENENLVCPRYTKINLLAKDQWTEVKDILWREKNAENWNVTERQFDLEKFFPFHSNISLEFKARDFSGNESAVIDFSCVMDKKPPETTIRYQK